jgi:ATP-dependent helicase/nuclease subunit A
MPDTTRVMNPPHTKSESPFPDHVAIAASAGSGKTFQLAHRYIRLLVNGVPPDRICALTFSRKAAQEIFDEIIKYLVTAARSDQDAREMSERLGNPTQGVVEYLEALRAVVSHLNRLYVGTLDSFIIGVVRAFPSELGVNMDFKVMDEGGAVAQDVRRAVMASIFNPETIPPNVQREFFEAFKQATFGREEKDVDDSLDRFVEEYRSHYRSIAEESVWGGATAIWPATPHWSLQVSDISETVAELNAALAETEMHDKVRERWSTLMSAAAGFNEWATWPKDADTPFKNLIAVVDDIRKGHATFSIDRKKQVLDETVCALVLKVLEYIATIHLRMALESTRGLHRVLAQYETVYDAWTRRSGQFTFSDAQLLLTESNQAGRGRVLSREAGVEGRIYIDYRLDAKLDHWLLDEFQDTSDLQWAAISNLVDELLQDAPGRRSFFYVGDVKQAIYSWRRGNPRLFGQILKQYGQDRIRQEHLSTSYRSGEAVIKTVNRVFGDIEHPDMPAATKSRWNTIWKEHRCRSDEPLKDGCVAVLEPRYDGNEKPTEDDRYALTASLIRELDPLRRGFTVAVLVRTNSVGRDVVQHLRNECPQLPVIHEGNAPICDNPTVTVILSLVKFAAHPGDSWAWRHLQMSPLGDRVNAIGRHDLPLQLLRDIQTLGFRALVHDWCDVLGSVEAPDAFGRMRIEDLLRAAGDFDSTGNRDCDAFRRHIEHYEISETAAEHGVRVMTIHQSKGLGFDVVILPDLMQHSMLKARNIDLLEYRDIDTQQPKWVLKMPRKMIAQHDPVLGQALRECDENACFDALCLLYVAMTRAKRAIYMISSYPGKTATMVSEASFVKYRLLGDPKPVVGDHLTLGDTETTRVYLEGNWGWHETLRAASDAKPSTSSTAIDFHDQETLGSHLVPVEPSLRESIKKQASYLFDRENRDVLDFGNTIHELFAQVTWSNEADIDAIIDAWARNSVVSEDVKRDSCNQFRCALQSKEVQQALSKAPGNVELWREQSFEIVLQEEGWVRGTFDRVVIFRDESGKAYAARVQDFKSDRVRDENAFDATAATYRPQLTLYGKAVAEMLGLNISEVSLQLVFTRAPRVYDLTA